VSNPFIYLTNYIRYVANGIVSHGDDIDLCIRGSAVNKIKSELESKTILSTQIGKSICKVGRIFRERYISLTLIEYLFKES
jgi:hypothetical protein